MNNTMNNVEALSSYVSRAATDLDMACGFVGNLEVAEQSETVAKLLWLAGYAGKDTAAELLNAAAIDALQDPFLLVWLNQSSPAEFLAQFEGDDFQQYVLTDVSGSEEWARVVIERARGLVEQGDRGTHQWLFGWMC